MTNGDFVRTLAEVLGRPALLPVPAFALRALFGEEMADAVILGGVRALPARLRAAGFRFEHPELRAGPAGDAGQDRRCRRCGPRGSATSWSCRAGESMALHGITLPETARLRLDSGAPELRLEELALPEELEPGRPVRLIDRDAEVLACGVADPENGVVRILSRQELRGFDAAFFRGRLQTSLSLRQAVGLASVGDSSGRGGLPAGQRRGRWPARVHHGRLRELPRGVRSRPGASCPSAGSWARAPSRSAGSGARAGSAP